MSLKSNLIKMAIKLTPNFLVSGIANIVLRDIAKLNDFSFDLDNRTAYAQVQLVGESEFIEVWLDGFVVINEADSKKFFIQQARSNRIWLDNLLSRVIGKTWNIPNTSHTQLLAELLKPQ